MLMVVFAQRLDLVILEVFSNINDSVSLGVTTPWSPPALPALP